MRTADLTAAGLMAGIAAVLQAGPVFWPGPGYLLAVLSSLPMAVLALYRPRPAPLGALATVLLLSMIHVEEAVVFGLTTGPLGLVVGYGARARLPRWLTALLAATLLTGGMVGLARLSGLPPLGPWVTALGPGADILVYFTFALVYAGIWVWLFGSVARRLLTALRRK